MENLYKNYSNLFIWQHGYKFGNSCRYYKVREEAKD